MSFIPRECIMPKEQRQKNVSYLFIPIIIFPVLLKEVDYTVIWHTEKYYTRYVMMPLELKKKISFHDKDQTSFHDHVTSSPCALLATVSLQPRSTINQETVGVQVLMGQPPSSTQDTSRT